MEYSENIEDCFLSPSFRLPRVRKRRGEIRYSFMRDILERNYVWQPHLLFMALQGRIIDSPCAGRQARLDSNEFGYVFL